MPPPGTASARPSPLALIPVGTALLAAAGWLGSRVSLGLDFTDEMQYYGEICGLVRTNRFFHDDLFLQQLGYVFLWPFFKLHALLFPGLDFLVLFGRLLLLGAYALTATVFWRAAGRPGGFTTPQKVAGLAVLLSWIPFQLFAFSYNTTSCLLLVALVAGWVRREAGQFPRYTGVTAALLAMLTYTYPPVGLTFIAVALVEAALRLGRRPAFNLLLTTLAAGVAVGLAMLALHGADFFADLGAAVAFTRGFGLGLAIRQSDNLGGWLVSMALAGLFVWRLRRGRPFGHPWGAATPTALRWSALGLVIITGSALLGVIINWVGGFFSISVYLGLLLVLAAATPPAGDRPVELHFADLGLLRRAMLAVLLAGSVALLVILMVYLRPGTGYFAHTIFLLLLVLLALDGPGDATGVPVGLALAGTVAGAVFSFTSGNGLHNFGVGAAGVIPFLVLHGTRKLDRAGPGRCPPGVAVLAPAVVALFLANAALHPYAEQKPWLRFLPVEGVPAFRGIRTSPVKVEAVARLAALVPPGGLGDRRVLVIGPQPWLYFLFGGRPATPMFFMHFDGKAAVDRVVGERLFQDGPPDCVVLAAAAMPPPIGTQVLAWSKEGFTNRKVSLPADFITAFLHETGYRLAPEVFLLERAPARP